jgi:hypothetical protein
MKSARVVALVFDDWPVIIGTVVAMMATRRQLFNSCSRRLALPALYGGRFLLLSRLASRPARASSIAGAA